MIANLRVGRSKQSLNFYEKAEVQYYIREGRQT
jgi:hypothetical protein